MGDINAMNILVDVNGHISLIDVDSYQFKPFKCKVGRPEFTHPDKIGKRYEEYFREPKDELFGIAILVFMILLPGKHPFARLGGESIIDNIKQRDFPYRISTAEGSSYANAPIGPWRFIWSHIPLAIKQILYETLVGHSEPKNLGELQRITLNLIQKLKGYAHEIKNGKRSNEIFPGYYYIPDHIPKVSLKCSKCGRYFEITQEYYESIKHRTEKLCPSCLKLQQLRKTHQKVLSSIFHSSALSRKRIINARKTKRRSSFPRTTTIKRSRRSSTKRRDAGKTIQIVLILVSLFLLIFSPVLALFILILLAIAFSIGSD